MALSAALGALAAAPVVAQFRGEVRIASFTSLALGVRKHYVVYLPPSYARNATRRYPVAYYLHGADGNEADWISRAAIDWVMDSLVARGMPEMILAMPDGDESWYTTAAMPTPYADCLERGRFGEDPTLRCVVHPRYDEYIAHDLVAHVDSTYRTRADAAHRAIGGLSMGGYGALTLALAHPDIFSAAVSHSGITSLQFVGPHPFAPPARYSTSPDTLRAEVGERFVREFRETFGAEPEAWTSREPIELARRLAHAGRRVPALFFDAGNDDALATDRNRAFDAELTALGILHRYAEWPGGHTWRYWRAHVGEGLDWLARAMR